MVTSALIEHPERSVVKIDADKLITRKELMLKYLFSNKVIAGKLLIFKRTLKTGAFFLCCAPYSSFKAKQKKSSKIFI